MMSLKQYHFITKLSVFLVLFGFFLYANVPMFILAYLSSYVFVIIRMLNIHSKKRIKFLMASSYSFIFCMQLLFLKRIEIDEALDAYKLFGKLLAVFFIVIPFILERFFIVNKYAAFYFPSVEEVTTFTFTELKENKKRILGLISEMKRLGHKMSPEIIAQIVTDLPRHSSFRYVNNGTLTDKYFEIAYDSLNDENIYIIISNTGTPASEIISVFTRKQYNHASISFDKNLLTIISYNAGERFYPPGLNQEMVEFFNKKQDSSIIVYRLATTYEQKKKIIDKVKEINSEGSAYNMMGLVLKYSHKSNIMFCSQFVYKMLKYAGIQYFEMPDGKVRPSDLVEQDYHRRLSFEYEIMLNESKPL